MEKSGWLIKKGRRRWFYAVGGVIYWFNKENKPGTLDFKKKANGNLQLGSRVTVLPEENSKKFGFRISGAEKGEYVLVAQNQEEMQSWIDFLCQVINNINASQTVFEKQGYLMKSGKRMFFRLKAGDLLWFLSEQEAKLKGKLNLLGCTVERKVATPNILITTPDRSMELIAKTVESAEEWTCQIDQACRDLMQTPLYKYNQTYDYALKATIAIEVGSVSEMCSSTSSAEQIKQALFVRVKRDFPSAFESNIFSTDAFFLRISGINHYILEEATPLYKLPIFKLLRRAFAIPKLELIAKFQLIEEGINISDLVANNEKLLNFQTEFKRQIILERLVGDSLAHTLASKPSRDDELHCYRREMAKFIIEFENNKNHLPQFLSKVEGFVPQTTTVLNVLCHLPGDKDKTVSVDVSKSVKEVKELIFDKYKRIDIRKASNKTTGNYLLKTAGSRSYFLNDDQSMLEYEYVQSCLRSGEKMSFALIETEDAFEASEKSSVVDRILAVEEEKSVGSPKKATTIREYTSLFRLRVNSAENMNMEDFAIDTTSFSAFVLVELYHGGLLIDEPLSTRGISFKHSFVPETYQQDGKSQQTNRVAWNQWLAFSIPLCKVPRAARICMTVYVQPEPEGEARPIGWASYQLIDHRSHFASGGKILKLWPNSKANPIGTCVDNISAQNPTLLSFEFEKFEGIIFSPATEVPPTTEKKDGQPMKFLALVINRDSLVPLSPEEKNVLWDYRANLVQDPKALPKLLLSVNWTEPAKIAEAHRLLEIWAPLSPVQALQLLDANFADAKVREFAVKALDALPDEDLSDYLLQLTQVIKYEPHHDSELARFLLRRAFNSKDTIGQQFFWFLKSEMHVPEITERFGLLSETYLRGCGYMYKMELAKQVDIMDQLTSVAMKIKEIPKKEERVEKLKYFLRQIEFPERFQLPLFTNIESKGLIIDKCRVMTSKKLPLWLVFQNADKKNETLSVIFKCGDDLRQDVLTLQMIKLMDKLWKREGHDLRLSPYQVIATGDSIGMLEIVLNSETTASINREAGGSRSVLVKDTLSKWLRDKNSSEDAYKKAVETFALSCAGYCVATYVIGIGDRHNDNVMLSKMGNLFHIDFGHFLGHFKKKFGIEREKAPFVFTPQYAHVLGGKGSPMYQLFEETCCTAYNIIRKHSELFINLFSMMLSTGLSELQSVDNIMFLRDQLALDLTDDGAKDRFKSLIDQSLTTKTQQFMDMVHIWAN